MVLFIMSVEVTHGFSATPALRSHPSISSSAYDSSSADTNALMMSIIAVEDDETVPGGTMLSTMGLAPETAIPQKRFLT